MPDEATSILKDDLAVSLARAMAVANKKARELGVDVFQSLISITQHTLPRSKRCYAGSEFSHVIMRNTCRLITAGNVVPPWNWRDDMKTLTLDLQHSLTIDERGFVHFPEQGDSRGQ